MEIEEFPNCCSAIIISDFYTYPETTQPPEKERILQGLKNYFGSYLENEGPFDYPKTFFATTNSQCQFEWEIALKELGFKPRKFASRHANTASNKYLNFWSLYTIPKDLKPFIKEQIKRIKDDNG